ncbi:hypothetical protein [Prosthecobacter sp.]|uniref:hypothetical protein n=1 Tax=Prosthecobacter sp. TaxID=1965333 RepID=UPI002489E7C5|nr:hypothetical protein [Prosthecobacter sp.]MDI1310658.1 hypothetical protein [Prosthecobacter sp.]
MPKYAILIHGVNFLIHDADATAPQLRGFYINAFLDALTPQEAEDRAVELVRTSPKLRAIVTNGPDDPPQMFIEELAELDDWPADCVRPLSGFVYYDDPNAEWRHETHADS